jgi:hypothetical protein
MILSYADEIHAMFRPELGPPERFVDSIAWPFEVDKDALNDALFQSTRKLADGSFFTMSPMGVLCSGREFIPEYAVRRLIAATIDFRLNHKEKDSVEILVMKAGPLLLDLDVESTPLSEQPKKGLELLQERKDVWTWLVGAFQGTHEYEDIAAYDSVQKQERDEAIVDLYEMILV